MASRISEREKEIADIRLDMEIMSSLMGQITEYKSLLERIVAFAEHFMPAETIYLVETIESDGGDKKIKLAVHSDRSVYSLDEKEIPKSTFIGSAIRAKVGMVINSPKERGKFKVEADPCKLKNAMAVPMIGIEGDVLGAIIWQNRVGGDFKAPFDKKKVNNFVRTSANVLELAKSVKQIRRLADYDQMTELIRRDRLASFVEKLIADRNFGPWMHFVITDLDGFKSINDKFGHTVGDELIKVCANYLKKSCNSPNLVCSHWGGDEFALAMLSYSKEEGETFAEEKRRGMSDVANQWIKEKALNDCSLTVSAGGCSIMRSEDVNYNILVKAADDQLYAAKEGGKNRLAWKRLTG